MFIRPSQSWAEAAASPAPVGALVAVVVDAILEVFFLCAVGWIMARRGIVDDKAKKILNKINVTLFTPALLFSKVAFSLTPDKLRDLAIIPIGFVIVSCFSAAVAWLMGTAFRLKKGQRNFAIACAMFQNSNSLPIALMQSLIGEKMPLAWGPHDTKDQMLGRALSYLVLFSTLGIIVRWSIGVRLLTSAEAEVDTESEDEGDNVNDEQENVLTNYPQDDEQPLLQTQHPNTDTPKPKLPLKRVNGNLVNSGSVLVNGEPSPNGGRVKQERRPSSGGPMPSMLGHTLQEAEAQDEAIRKKKSLGFIEGENSIVVTPRKVKGRSQRQAGGRVFHSFPNTPIPSRYGSEDGNGRDDDHDDEEDSDGDDPEWGAERGAGRGHAGFLDSGGAGAGETSAWSTRWHTFTRKTRWIWKPVKRVSRKISQFMTVPLWAALLSIFVACVPPLQKVLNEAEPLKAAIKTAGNCSVPITLVTLGAYFYRPSSPLPPSTRLPPRPTSLISRLNPFSQHARATARARGAKRGESRTVLVAVMTRMIVVPLILLPLFGWYAALTNNVADDPVFVVVACLLIGSPTAITLAQITSSAAGETFEILISRTLFVSYAVLTAPCTILLVLAALYIDRKQ